MAERSVASADVMPRAGEPLHEGEIEKLVGTFETARRFDENEVEFWTARDLSDLLGYARWENFEAALSRAVIACTNSGQAAEDHFQEVFPDVTKNPLGGRPSRDIRLTRYACYLVAQNGDSRKKPVAFAQTYFAIQTRRQELSDRAAESDIAVPESEDGKRVLLRGQIKEHNRYLSSAAKDAGVSTPQEFAIFHSKGYQGQYGLTVPQIRQHRSLAKTADILDRMGSTELAANFFRVTQTEEKLRKDKTRGINAAYSTHYAVGRQVRDAMLKISGIAPEDLPVADNISQAEKRLKNEQSKEPVLTVQTPTSLLQKQLEEREELSSSLETTELSRDDRHLVDLKADLWKYALLIMATKPGGAISTSDLIAELPKFLAVPDDSRQGLAGRSDTKFSQLVRNLKSHKTAKTNFIYQGLAVDQTGGFSITEKGRSFVATYFSTK